METPANRGVRTRKKELLRYFIGQAFAHIDTEMFRCDYRFSAHVPARITTLDKT
jgi:hypothetical protein